MAARRDPTVPDTFYTPLDDVFVRSHLGVPHIDASSWSLTVDGLVHSPVQLAFDAMHKLPQIRRTAFHECFGDPLRPQVPTRAVANIDWWGVALSTILEMARPLPNAQHAVFVGADTGSFAGRSNVTYLKDLPLTWAWNEAILAHSMNGEPLRPRHGFPLRLVAPRMFATNSVKWLTRIVLASERPDHLFTTQLYTRVPDGAEAPQPVRQVDVNAKLLFPHDGAHVHAGDVELAGRAWSSTEIIAVHIAVDNQDWQPASVERRGREPVWQRFTTTQPLMPGRHTLRVRATDAAGHTQPPTGTRNAVQRLALVAH
jgi:DMSO/TMAO reductase YedYZ molybdopterin-dependent catalytic subunit